MYDMFYGMTSSTKSIGPRPPPPPHPQDPMGTLSCAYLKEQKPTMVSVGDPPPG